MKLGKSVDVLWFQLKLVVSYIRELNARWKRGPNRMNLSSSDGGLPCVDRVFVRVVNCS